MEGLKGADCAGCFRCCAWGGDNGEEGVGVGDNHEEDAGDWGASKASRVYIMRDRRPVGSCWRMRARAHIVLETSLGPHSWTLHVHIVLRANLVGGKWCRTLQVRRVAVSLWPHL